MSSGHNTAQRWWYSDKRRIMSATQNHTRLTFGLFEVDLEACELWKAGFRIKLQSQPFKVLACLLEKPGHVVTREELQLRLWGKDTVVDFDHSLGTAVNKIREALGDSADNPRFIETLARRGYRFIAPVGYVDDTQLIPPAARPTAAPAAPEPAAEPATPPSAESAPISAQEETASWIALRQKPLVMGGAAALLAFVAAAIGYSVGLLRSPVQPPHITQITHSGHLAPSANATENLAAGVTDGVHLYAATLDNGHSGISAIDLTGGATVPVNLPGEVASPMLGDISPDGSRLLVRDHLSPESEQPLWVVPTIGGSAQRVGNVLAHDATWMPDGGGLLYANGNDLYLTHLTGNAPELYAPLPGRAFWLRWEPNGHLLRFTVIDPIAHTLSLWQLAPGDGKSPRKPERLLAGFSDPSSECCGVWTADGSAFVFQSSHDGNANLWQLSGESTRSPRRLTDGPLQFQSPVAARTGRRIFFLGTDSRSELERISPTGALTPDRSFLSAAVRIDTTRDEKWVAWTDAAGQLWRARADGSEQLQLSPDGLVVFLARWSPDGSRLAVMAREPGKAWQLYLIGANGGEPQPLLKEQRNAADPSWSPDGQTLVFGRLNDTLGKENAARTLELLHLASGQIEEVPGSDGLFSPRWSPDGKYIAALTLDQRQVRVLDLAAHTWRTLPVTSGADPVWAADSRSLYVHASLDPSQPIDRISIPDGKVTELVRLADPRAGDAVDFVFGGLAPGQVPVVRTRIFTGNLYSLDLPK